MSEPSSIDTAKESFREHGTDPRVQRAGRWIGAALFVAMMLWPNLGLDALQRRAAAVTALVATLWLTQGIPLGAASLLPAVLLPLFGVVPAREAAAVYMDDIVMLFFGAFVVAAGLERWGVHRRMALALVDVVGTQPRRLVLGFTLATAFVSLWINNTAATLMMYPIGLAVIATTTGAAASRSNPFAISLLLGIAYGASIGGVATPVGTAPNQIFLGMLRQHFPRAPVPTFGEWTIGWLPFALVFCIGTWWLITSVGLRVPKSSLAARETIQIERRKLGRMTRGEISMSIVFALTALLWVTREDLTIGSFTLPGWGSSLSRAQALGLTNPDLAKLSRYVSDATIALAMGCLCFFVPVEPKKGVFLLDWETVSKLPWDVLLLFGGGFCIAKGFQASGLDAKLGTSLAPLLQGQPQWLVIAIIAAFMTFLSELTSNTVITQLMLPVLAQTAVSSGLDPRLLMIPATVAASSGFALPVATPPNAIAFSSRLIPMGTMGRLGVLVDLLGIVLITLAFQYCVAPVLGIEAGLPDWARP